MNVCPTTDLESAIRLDFHFASTKGVFSDDMP